MNQILSEESPKNRKKNKKTNIYSILVIFSFFLIIFGIGLTSTGAYSYYKSLNKNPIERMVSDSSKPNISIEIESANKKYIVVQHDKEISKVTYRINDEEPVEIDTNGETEVRELVILPAGSVKLTVIAEDVNGVKASRESLYEIEDGPTIILEQNETKIQATTTSNINIATIKYYWDDDEANVKEFTINDVKNVTQIDAKEGNHTLVVIATDIEGNETTKTQKVIADIKPTLNVTTDGEKFLIEARDDEGLTKIQYKLNSGEVITENIEGTENTKTIKLLNGENKLLVRVYNKNSIAETAKVKFVKE